MGHTTFRTTFGLLLVLACEFAVAGMEDMDIRYDPYTLGGRVSIEFSGRWPSSCVPDRPGFISLGEDSIEFHLVNTGPGQGSGCDFSFMPYSFTVRQINIPADSVLRPGTVNMRSYVNDLYTFPIFLDEGTTEISLGRLKERYIPVGFENDGVLLLRRSDFSLYKRLSTRTATKIHTGDGLYYKLQSEMLSSGYRFSTVNSIDPYLLDPTIAVAAVTGHAASDSRILDTLGTSALPYYGLPPTFVLVHDYLGNADVNYDYVQFRAQESFRYVFLDSQPHSMALDPAAGMLYVSLPDSNSLQVLNASDLTPSLSIDTGASPTLLFASTDGSKIAVYLADQQRIGVLDTNSATVIQTFPLLSPAQGIIHDPVLPQFYIWDSESRVYALDHQALQMSQPLELEGELAGLSLNPDGNEMFAFSRMGQQTRIDVFDTNTFSLQESTRIGGRAIKVPEFISREYWVSTLGSQSFPVPAISKTGFGLTMLFMLLLGALAIRNRRRVVTGS